MWNAVEDPKAMPDFWPPRPSRFSRTAFEPFRRRYFVSHYRIAEVALEGAEACFGRFATGDGVLLAPNHSHDSDPHVMLEAGRRLGRQVYFMAAWQLFRERRGWTGRVMQRMGAFSVDREGVDRRAIRQAADLLIAGQTLVVFPEGEIYRLNERLTPLLEGVAFIAGNAQRGLNKANATSKVWIAPAAIRYTYLDDIRPKLAATMDRLEARPLLSKPPPGEVAAGTRSAFGEVLLTLKEKEQLGRSCEAEGDLPAHIRRLIEAVLERLETAHLGRSPSGETTPLRVKALRRTLLERRTDDRAAPSAGGGTARARRSSPRAPTVQPSRRLPDAPPQRRTHGRDGQQVRRGHRRRHSAERPPPGARWCSASRSTCSNAWTPAVRRTAAAEMTEELEQACKRL